MLNQPYIGYTFDEGGGSSIANSGSSACSATVVGSPFLPGFGASAVAGSYVHPTAAADVTQEIPFTYAADRIYTLVALVDGSTTAATAVGRVLSHKNYLSLP